MSKIAPATGSSLSLDTKRVYEETGRLLVTPMDLESGAPLAAGPLSDRDREAMNRVLTWFFSHITVAVKKHDKVEAVCPMVKPSIAARLLFLAIAKPRDPTNPDDIISELDTFVRIYDHIPGKNTRENLLRGLVVLYPDTPGELLHVRMTPEWRSPKTRYFRHGVMVGEFFPGNPEAPSWDPNARPGSSPVPFYLLRALIETDYKFIRHIPGWRRAFRIHFPNMPENDLTRLQRAKRRAQEWVAPLFY